MQSTNYLFKKFRNSMYKFALFMSISSAFATNTFEDKPLKDKTSQKSETVTEHNQVNSLNNSMACQPRNCTPITITKSKTLVNSTEAFSSFLADSTMNISVTPNNNHIIYEYGLRFTVTQNSKMIKVGSRLPKSGIYRITIWDVATKTVITQQYVAQTINNVQSWADITALPLEANKEYFISIISDNWNDANPKAVLTVAYPIIKGNLKILAFAYASQPTLTSSPRYPDMEDNAQSISGFVDFGLISN